MRIATAFYDRFGTLAAIPDHIANPYNDPDTTAGFPTVPIEYSSEVTVDPGFYHRFAMVYPSEMARARAAVDLLDIFSKYNTSVLVDNSNDFYFELELDMYPHYRENNIPIPRPGQRYALDVIYLVEDGIRPRYDTLPRRDVDTASVSEWIDHDPIATSRGMEGLPDPSVAYPDLAGGYFNQQPSQMHSHYRNASPSTGGGHYSRI